MAKKQRLRSGFTLGGEQAESDHLLTEAFFESSDYDVLTSKDDNRCFIIGRTGSGKSAALQRLQEMDPEHVIRINPEDLSLPYITDLQVIRYLDQIEVNLDLFWIALWKHVLLVEIIRHRYQVNSPAAKQNFLHTIKQLIQKDQAKMAALQYLEEFEGRFWCETDERVREIADQFTSRVEAAGKAEIEIGPISAGAGIGKNSETSREVRRSQVDRFQRIVNETQLPRLNTMIGVLNDDILDHHHFTYVIIDDLDRDWVDERLANDLIRCLFRTVLDLKRVQNLKVLVALRTNIFQELDFGNRSGGQEEKFRALVLELRWTAGDLEELLDERVRVAASRSQIGVESIAELLPNANRAMGNPIEYILNRTLLRPRDAIAFANECMNSGVGKVRLSWDDVYRAERKYSQNRLLALRDEWKVTYPGVERVLEKFRGAPARMSKEDFQRRMDEAMLLLADSTFVGVRWLTTVSSRVWASGSDYSWFDIYQPMLHLLYMIGFVGCATSGKVAPTFFGDDPLLVESERTVSMLDWFYVHRTYQKALDIQTSGRS